MGMLGGWEGVVGGGGGKADGGREGGPRLQLPAG